MPPPVSAYHDSLLRSPVFLGMVMFLGSEIMLFGSFFTIFFYLRFTHTIVAAARDRRAQGRRPASTRRS